MLEQIILVDGMSVFYSFTYSFVKDGEVPTEEYIRAASFNALSDIAHKFNHAKQTYIILDGKNNWRFKVFDQYKAKRKADKAKTDFDWNLFHKRLDAIIEEMNESYPALFVRCDTCEADDVIAYLAANISKAYSVTIVSPDKDYLQLQDYYPNINQYSMRNQDFITQESRDLTLVEHILKGDYSDGIPNIMSSDDTYTNPNKKTIRFKPTEYKYMKDLSLEELEKYIQTKYHSDIYKNFLRNKQLIDFREIPKEIHTDIIQAIKNNTIPLDKKQSLKDWILKHDLEYIPYDERVAAKTLTEQDLLKKKLGME